MKAHANNMNSAEEIIEIPLGSDLYPVSLSSIKNPPKVLYARGNLSLLKQPPGVSIVGTRNATSNGLKITHRISQFVVSQNAIVISGLALGIDAAAHNGCLDVGGQTIAVLAGGLHEATPKQNSGLGQRILQNNGLWVSEHEPGIQPQKRFFVARNRIQVGLSACSIVVESDIQSGTTSHAQFCVNENHPLFAVVPEAGNPMDLRSAGPEMMVGQMRAIPLRSKQDYNEILKVVA